MKTILCFGSDNRHILNFRIRALIVYLKRFPDSVDKIILSWWYTSWSHNPAEAQKMHAILQRWMKQNDDKGNQYRLPEVVLETGSKDTRENLLNSREQLTGDVVLLSSEFHLPRIDYLSKSIGVTVDHLIAAEDVVDDRITERWNIHLYTKLIRKYKAIETISLFMEKSKVLRSIKSWIAHKIR